MKKTDVGKLCTRVNIIANDSLKEDSNSGKVVCNVLDTRQPKWNALIWRTSIHNEHNIAVAMDELINREQSAVKQIW